MVILKVLGLRGPNVWGRSPALEAWIDLKGTEGAAADAPEGFEGRLALSPPTRTRSKARRRAVGWPGREAEALGRVAAELQRQVGIRHTFHRVRATHRDGVYRVAVGYEEEELARACLDAADGLCRAAREGRRGDAAAEIERLRGLAGEVRLGPGTRAIVDAARARGIPTRRLNAGNLVQLGYGARSRRILTAETDRTGAIAESIARDKELTRALLREIGVPAPEGRAVADAADAWDAARAIGGPVVVKPRYGNQGRGVAVNLSTRAQVAAAYEAAAEESAEILVERFAPGSDYRLLIVGGQLAAAARREPARVIGDGVATIKMLIEALNRDPRRRPGHVAALSPIPLDAVALGVLAEQGCAPDSVPAAGAVVLVRRNANLSTGGTAEDVTDRVHPEVAARAVEAARVVGLDVAGVDVVAESIDRPLEDQGGVVVEVNAGPGLRMHLEPTSGRPRPVGRAIVDTLFGPGDNGRIPIVGVTGVNGKTTTTRLIAHILRGTGARVGMTNTDGIYLGERRIEAGDCSGPASARAILSNPSVDAAVLETARGGILRAGLGFDRCDVAVVTNIGEGDHLGLSDIETLPELARVKRTLVDAVAPTGAAVLKADDPLVAPMAAYCPGSTTFFALDGAHPVISAHRARGGRAVFARDGVIVLAAGNVDEALTRLDQVPLTHGGRVAFQAENTLAAVAATWALGVPVALIGSGLTTFTGDVRHAPGRFNIVADDGLTVIVDYGHNPSAIAALTAALDRFPNPRRAVVFTAAGDRRDADLVRQGQLLGDAVDRALIYSDKSTRGRPPGEIVALLRRGLDSGRRVSEVLEVGSEAEAVAAAIGGASKGELIVVQSDDTGDLTLDLVRRALDLVSSPLPSPVDPETPSLLDGAI